MDPGVTMLIVLFVGLLFGGYIMIGVGVLVSWLLGFK